MAGSGRKTIEIALYLSFALSGAAALLAQTVWQRELVRLVGSTTPSTSVVYAGVMAGLGAGALLGNAVLARGGSLFMAVNPLRFFALLEAIACAFAILYAVLFRSSYLSFGSLLTSSVLADESLRQALAFILVAVPSIAMGATWPAVVAGTERISLHPGKSASFLYAANLLGAWLGVAGGAFLLIPSLGLSMSLALAGALNILSSLLAVVISLAAVNLISPQNSIDRAASSKFDEIMPQFDCLIVFLSAAATLALEVVFTRLFTLVLGSSTYSVGIVVCGVIFALSISASLGWIFSARKSPIFSGKSVVAFLASLGALTVFAEAALLNCFPDLVLYFGAMAAKSNFPDYPLFGTYLFPRMMICACVVLLPVVFVSAIFPVVLSDSLKKVNAKTSRASWLYSASTLGAVVGALSCGLYLIPAFSECYESGLLATLIVIAGLCLLIAALVASQQISIASQKSKTSGIVFLFSAAVIGLVSTMYPPHADTFLLSQGLGLFPVEGKGEVSRLRRHIEESRAESLVLFYREGLNTTVTVEQMANKNLHILKNDGKVEAAIPRNPLLPAASSDYPTQMLLGILPYVLNTKDKLDALVIGCGSGATYGALAKQMKISNLTVVELEKAVFDASQYFLGAEKRAERADIHKVVCDARSHLNYASGNYDLIVSQPAEPWVNGAGDLYTEEFFRLLASKLSRGGIFCQWLQLYSIDEKTLLVLLNTLQHVFPSTYVFHPHGSGEILIVSYKPSSPEKRQALEPMKQIAEEEKLDLSKVEALMREPVLAKQLQYCHIESVPDLLSMLVLTPISLDELLWKKLSTERISINTDDNLRTEYSLPVQLVSSDDRIEKNLELLRSVHFSLLSCVRGLPEDSAQKAEFADRVALSMAGFSQKHPGEGLDESALAAAYEAWTLSQSAATASACDVISYMTGRSISPAEPLNSTEKSDSPSPAQAFWIAQAEALKGNKKGAAELIRKAIASTRETARAQELQRLLETFQRDKPVKPR